MLVYPELLMMLMIPSAMVSHLGKDDLPQQVKDFEKFQADYNAKEKKIAEIIERESIWSAEKEKDDLASCIHIARSLRYVRFAPLFAKNIAFSPYRRAGL